jgi:hypothetical protein
MTLMLGCAKPKGPLVPATVGDPDVVVALARSKNTADVLQARFSVKIDMAGRSFTVPAAMLMDHPDRFRFELYTPLGTPLATMTSDGQNLHVWSQRDRTFYRGDAAGDVLKGVAGGEVGIDDLLAIFTGSLPMVDSEILHVGRTVFDDGGGVVIVMLGPDDIRVRATIDPRLGIVRRLRVDPPTDESGYEEPSVPPLLEVSYDGIVREGRSVLPAVINIGMPRLNWSIRMTSKRWRALNEAPDAFSLVPPNRATVKDLVKTLEQLSQ